MKKLCAAALGLSLCGTAVQADPGWSPAFTIQSVIPTEQGLTLVATSDVNTRLGCASSNWLQINSTDGNYDLISATVLTAFSQSRPLQVWEASCTSAGTIRFIAAWVDR